MKLCSKCKTEKDLSEFNKAKNSADNLSSWCKCCTRYYMKTYRKNNKNILKEYKQNYYRFNKNKIKNKHKNYYNINKDKYSTSQKQYRINNKEKIQRIAKKYYKENKHTIVGQVQTYRKQHRLQINKHTLEKRKTDISYKILCNLRTRICEVIKNNSKSESTKQLLGCTVKFLKKHLEAKFTIGMKWDNHGRGWNNKREWHIDHIKPCASFDLSKLEEQQKCFHYTNLQPLWAKDNLKKGNNYGKCYDKQYNHTYSRSN